jgi:fumarylpyruvate hydrolase
MTYLFPPPARVSVPIVGRAERFPVHRVYCLVRNHAEHSKEMGFDGLEPPSCFLKPADAEALVVVEAGETGSIRYPSLSRNLVHEVELVVAIGLGGKEIERANAREHVLGYAVGLDMTRFDLLSEVSRRGQPWCIGKSFEHSATIGPITPASLAGAIDEAEIYLQVNGVDRQRSTLSWLIWDVSRTIEELSKAWTLQPGDLIYMGTPAGVAAVVPGDTMECGVAGLEILKVLVTAD